MIRTARHVVPHFLVIGVLAACGCSRGHAAASSASPPRGVAVAGGAGVAGGTKFAPAPSRAPDEAPAPQPTVEYGSLEQARDAIEKIVRRSVNPKNPAISVKRDTVTFKYWFAKGSARGWAIHVDVRDTSVCPIEAIEDAVQNAGWAQADGYVADGADGGEMGFATHKFFCLIEGHWEGGDESDTTYVPAPGCTVTATIVPRRADDVMR